MFPVMTGVNLEVSLNNIRELMQAELRNETAANYVGGNSTVLLYLLNSGSIQNDQNVWEQARRLNESVPGKFIIPMYRKKIEAGNLYFL